MKSSEIQVGVEYAVGYGRKPELGAYYSVTKVVFESTELVEVDPDQLKYHDYSLAKKFLKATLVQSADKKVAFYLPAQVLSTYAEWQAARKEYDNAAVAARKAQQMRYEIKQQEQPARDAAYEAIENAIAAKTGRTHFSVWNGLKFENLSVEVLEMIANALNEKVGA